jgi:hypothetical protein
MATCVKIRIALGVVVVLLAVSRGSVLLMLAGEQLVEDGECMQPGECVALARKYKPKCTWQAVYQLLSSGASFFAL